MLESKETNYNCEDEVHTSNYYPTYRNSYVTTLGDTTFLREWSLGNIHITNHGTVLIQKSTQHIYIVLYLAGTKASEIA